jgi:cobalt/nickel transport system permease protein
MHIPGHVLDPATSISTGMAAATAVGYSLYRVRNDRPLHSASRIGAVAACVFAVQMLSFPISGGTSGHLLGGFLAAIVLGPWAGMLAITAVLVVQCLLFGDGGLTALGANVLNMAVVGSVLGYAVYHCIRRTICGKAGQLAAAALASWFTVVVAAFLCAIEISIPGHYELTATLTAMVPAHALIGMGEALATTAAIACLLNWAPGSLYTGQQRCHEPTHQRRLEWATFAAALVMATLLSPFASSLPDTLEATLTVESVSNVAPPATNAVS